MTTRAATCPSRSVLGISFMAITVLAGCTERVAAPDLAASAPLSARAGAERRTSVRWNELARQLVAAHQIAPPRAARVFAYLSVAQDAAVDAARRADDGDSDSDASTRAAVLGASADILAHFFAGELGFRGDAALIAAEAARQRAALGDGAAGEALGRGAAALLIARSRDDGAGAAWTGTIPVGAGYWAGTPQLPAWGQLRTWRLRSGDQFRAPPPPAFGSARFLADLAEVRAVSDRRTAEQLRIATFWADGAGTVTPPGHWNEIAAALIAEYHLNERKAARALALVNVAMSDAVVGCWDSKYTYWVVRPYQADPLITTPIGKPPHPSYPSGHACSSNAAAGVLGSLFPKARARVDAMAAESGLSRIYGGIHYRFDIEAGAALGRSVASLVVAADRDGRRGRGRAD